MRMPSKIWLFFFMAAALLFGVKLNAQVENKLLCVALVKKDSIVIRWAPSSVPLWQTGIRYGYIVKRYTIAKNGVFLPDGLNNGIILTESPVRTFPEEYFEKLSLIDQRASVVQEAIFGKESIPGPDNADFKSFMKSYEEKEVRLGFALFMCDMSPVIARSAGLLFTDKEVVSGERYAYSIVPAGFPDGLSVEPAVVVVDAGTPTELPPILDVQAVFTSQAVRFRWPLTINKGVYSAYILEKSVDGKTFFPVSDLPLVNFSQNEEQDNFTYTDSLEKNNEKVWYQVKGISPFGETGPPSDVISGKGVPEFSAYTSVDTAWVNEKKQVVIRWRVTEGYSSKLREINVLRSGNYNGPFEPVNKRPLSSGARTFTDINPGQSNYYQVMLSGEGNLNSYSFPYFVQTEDNTPPAAPAMLSGNVDSSGAVTIIWKENTETDLMGYKVFRSNSEEGEFIASEQGIVPVNIWHDSINLNTLTKKIFYQIVAIDKNYNASEYSSILGLSRPDTITPSPATIKRINPDKEKISLSFDDSPSNDISAYTLFRLAEGDSTIEKVAEWKTLPEFFEDTFSGKSKRVEYRLMTIDNSGNTSSDSESVYAGSGNNKQVKLSAVSSSDGRTITVKWAVPDGFISGKTIIYRSAANNPISAYKTIAGELTMFSDEDVELNTGYTYRILVHNSGSDDLISSDELRFTPSAGSKKTRK